MRRAPGLNIKTDSACVYLMLLNSQTQKRKPSIVVLSLSVSLSYHLKVWSKDTEAAWVLDLDVRDV